MSGNYSLAPELLNSSKRMTYGNDK